MKLTVHTFLTLDGVMQAPGGDEEDTSGRFTRGGWLIPYADEGMGEIVDGWFSRAEEILLGRTTYEMMRDFWTQVTDPDDTVATALNGLPKHLVSSSAPTKDWPTTHLISGDPVEAVRELKGREGGELQVHGSAQLARTLQEAGLVDEYRLLVFPVVVGEGKRLFEAGAPPRGFEALESRTTSAGATYTALRPTEFRQGLATVVDGKDAVAAG